MDVLRRGNFVFQHENGTCDETNFHKLRQEVLKNILIKQIFFRENVKFGFPDFIRKDGSLKENSFQKTVYFMKNLFNVDPWNRKFYLTIHESLI